MATDPAVQAAAEAIAGCTSDEFAEMDRPQRVWYLNLAAAALKAAAPLIRAQAFTEAAEALTDRWPPELFSHTFYADDASIIRDLADLVRGLGEETENA